MSRTIKRYENRKLYDTQASAYVSLADIAAFVRAGETVQIVDNTSGRDLTAQTLTQIILEEGKQGKKTIPADVLHDLVRRSGQAIDAGIDQLRHSVDDLVQGSLDQVSHLLHGSRPRELAQLRDQLGRLEQLLTSVLGEAPGAGETSDITQDGSARDRS